METLSEREDWHKTARILISRLAILMVEHPDSEYLSHVHQQVMTDIELHDTSVQPPYKPHYQIG